MIILDPFLLVVTYAIQLYIYVVIISAVLSWLVHFGVVNTRNQFVSMLGDFLWRLTEPALRQIRRFVPRFGGLDISPIVLILALIFVQMVIGNIRIAMMRGL